MGQSISSALKSIDGGDASAQETKDTLNALYALGQSRVDAAYSQATSDRGNMYAPISKVILRRQQIVCKSSASTDGIAQGIKDSVGKLMSGQILDGVVDLIQNGMNIVLGASSGSISSTYSYALVATDLGALLRIDVDIYNFALQSQGLQSKIQNMTAISSLISSIDPKILTASDIRAVISVSYGGSTMEQQQAILDLVMKAWELDKKLLDATGPGVTPEDLAMFRAKVIPSKFDHLEPNGETQILPVRSAPKVDRTALLKAFSRLSVSNGTNGASDAKLADPVAVTPIRIWIKLQNPAEEMFIIWLKGLMSGLTVPGIFNFKEIDQDGYSGDALSLNCAIEAATTELFEKAISYVEDTVLFCLNNAGMLTRWISTMGIQYKHPGTDASGFVSTILFKQNQIINNTNDVITFHESGTEIILLSVQAGETGYVSGEVDYLSGAPPVAPAAANGAGEQLRPAATPSNPPGGIDIPKWVTYDTVAAGKILSTMPMTLTSNQGGGYVLSFTGPDDQVYSLVYGQAWPR